MDDQAARFVGLPPTLSYDPCVNFNLMREQQHLHSFSDDDTSEPGPSSSKQPRRGTRACDRCRKIKSKCEETEGEKCKNCQAAGTPCTFQGPSFKRGPPKGYIHAIEQRWHQVECILATVMALPRFQDIAADLRSDPFARDILNRVASGPYGSVGRSQTNTTFQSEDGFYNTIMGQANTEDRRSKRQSRQTREFVSKQDRSTSAKPTAEWQNQLYRRLAGMQGHQEPGTAFPYSTAPSTDRASYPSYSSSSSQPSPSIPPHVPGFSGQPSKRRRLEPSMSMAISDNDTGLLRGSAERAAPEEDAEEFDEATDTFGHLSVDQNNEFRYHGRSAGLHLLAKSDRKDDSQAQENGIWKFDIPKMEADCRCLSFDKVNNDIELPDFATQDELIMTYFSYVHHIFPVVHKASFLGIYNERRLDLPNKAVKDNQKREPMQTVTKLLLMAMFTSAAHYLPSTGSKKPYELANDYALKARRLLNTQYEDSKPSTCQALLLLGLREFGNGSISQGWMYTGMGCRMAVDLGMNRDPDNWKDASGKDLFTLIEKQIRRQIWWACCISDKICSVWLGRPVTFKKVDFSTTEPDFDFNDDEELWRPYPRDLLGKDFDPMAARVMVCFKEQCRLSFIICEIMANLYPVKLFDDGVNRRAWLDQLEKELRQWLIKLPEELHYREGTNKVLVPPHVIILHIEYHAALLLLHRAFLPNWKAHQKLSMEKDLDPAHNWCLDICGTAAARISSLIEAFDAIYSLTRAPPLLLSYLQSAGIMHVVILTRRPRDTQATIGLLQSIKAAEVLQDVWPEAVRIKGLLKGASVEMDDVAVMNQATGDRHKRGLDEFMGHDRTADLLFNVQSSHPPYNMFSGQDMPPSSSDAMSYIPGYEWWPQLVGPGTGGGEFGAQDFTPYQPSPLGSQLLPPQGLFTFNQAQMSPEFVHDVDAGQHVSTHAGPSHSHQSRNPSLPPGYEHHEQQSPYEQQQHRPYERHGYPPP